MKLPEHLTSNQKKDIKYAIKHKIPIIISGAEGVPTGKTTLFNLLKENGAIVYEKYECLEIELNTKLI